MVNQCIDCRKWVPVGEEAGFHFRRRDGVRQQFVVCKVCADSRQVFDTRRRANWCLSYRQ